MIAVLLLRLSRFVVLGRVGRLCWNCQERVAVMRGQDVVCFVGLHDSDRSGEFVYHCSVVLVIKGIWRSWQRVCLACTRSPVRFRQSPLFAYTSYPVCIPTEGRTITTDSTLKKLRKENNIRVSYATFSFHGSNFHTILMMYSFLEELLIETK